MDLCVCVRAPWAWANLINVNAEKGLLSIVWISFSASAAAVVDYFDRHTHASLHTFICGTKYLMVFNDIMQFECSSRSAELLWAYEVSCFLRNIATSQRWFDKKKTNDDKINSPVNYDVKHARNDGPMLFITRFSRASKEPFYRKQFNAISSNSATYLISTR